ncbi:MAG: hypothetical protein HY225_04260 [Candidatus Vogelbacteria bacterium]|nr:hypothetical protein [Candidatus Vogelbacteria bacterium]
MQNITDNITKQLLEIGLSDHEAAIYGTLLANSPASASFVAKKCNLARSSVYTALGSLTAKGLVGTTFKNEIKQFMAEGYPAIENLLKKEEASVTKKIKSLEGIKETLKAFGNAELKIPQIIVFEGQESLKKIYLSMLREAPNNSTMYILRDEFVWKDPWSFIFTKEWSERVKRFRKENNIKTKLLLNDSKEEHTREKYYKSRIETEYRFLPKENTIKDFVIYIVGDVISILSMEKNNLIGIKITNDHIASNFKNIFEVAWKKSMK